MLGQSVALDVIALTSILAGLSVVGEPGLRSLLLVPILYLSERYRAPGFLLPLVAILRGAGVGWTVDVFAISALRSHASVEAPYIPDGWTAPVYILQQPLIDLSIAMGASTSWPLALPVLGHFLAPHFKRMYSVVQVAVDMLLVPLGWALESEADSHLSRYHTLEATDV